MEKANHNDLYEMSWKSGAKILSTVDTVFESDNGLELEDPNYEEYWSVGIKLVEIIKIGPELEGYSAGEYIELNYHNVPDKYDKLSA